ncbi:uncharacterized protein LOC144646366 [Oculina patagonica]
MSNRAVFGLFLAVGIIFGAVRTSSHARCKTRREELQAERSRVNEESERKRLDLKEKEANNQLTDEYLITTVNEIIASVTDLKMKFEIFCNDCPRALDNCPDIISRMNKRINRLQEKLEEHQKTDGGLTVDGIIPMPLSAPGSYDGVFG